MLIRRSNLLSQPKPPPPAIPMLMVLKARPEDSLKNRKSRTGPWYSMTDHERVQAIRSFWYTETPLRILGERLGVTIPCISNYAKLIGLPSRMAGVRR